MRGLLKELNHLLSTKYELNLRGISNQHISYDRVPRTTSDHTFTNSKEWLDTAINISGSKKGGTFESAYRIVNHLIKYYKDSFLAACETQQVPVIKPMTLIEPILWNYILEKDLNEEDDLSIDEDDSLQSVRKSPTSPPPLTALSAAVAAGNATTSLHD